jgi:hypothetical protein
MAEGFDKRWLLEFLLPIMHGTRQRRMFIEREWLLNYRSWQGWVNRNYQLPLPDGSFYYFIPHARVATEKAIETGVELALPDRDWYQNLPFDGQSHQNAEAVHNALQYIYEKKLSTRRNVESLLRCLRLYNLAVLNTSVQITGKAREVWPYQEAVDPFNFYVFPETTQDYNKAFVVFEDVVVPYQVYYSFVDRDNEQKSLYSYIKPSELSVPLWPYHLIERLAYKGLTNPADWTAGMAGNIVRRTEEDFQDDMEEKKRQAGELLNAQAKAFTALSKVYFRLGSQWFYTVICTNYTGGDDEKYEDSLIVRLDEAETLPLYRWTSTRSLPGELYTNSRMDDIRGLQNLTNNAISDVEANRRKVQTAPIAVDMTQEPRMQEKTFADRQVWGFQGSPREIIMPLEVADVTEQGTRMWQLYKGLIDVSSNTSLAEGEPGRNTPRSGMAAQNLLDFSMSGIRNEVKTITQDILTPSLSDCYHIILEYIPDKQIIKIPNQRPELVKAYKKQDLYGDYSFTWLAGLDFQASQDRADKLAQFFQIILNPQLFPLIQSQLNLNGETLDLKEIFSTYYSSALGEKGLSALFRKMTDPEQQEFQGNQEKAKQDPRMMEVQARMGLKGQELKQKGQLQIAKQQQDLQLQREKHQGELAIKGVELHGKQQQVQGDSYLKQLDMELKKLDTMGKLISISAGPTQNGQRKPS